LFEEDDEEEDLEERVLLPDEEPERLFRTVVPELPVREPLVLGESTFSVLLRV
jgi:hypothetical protein